MTDSTTQSDTERVEETAIVGDAEDLSRWADRVTHLFSEQIQADYPETVTIAIEWEDDDE